MQQLNRDGVQLVYDEAGAGSPPMIFIHGLGCDHSHFAPQFERYRHGHRVIALDLRGHGQSDKPEQEYTIEGLADDAAWLCGELGVYRPVLVGHSMGSLVALELAARHPDIPAALVLLDAPLFVPPPVVEAMNLPELARAMWTPAYRDVLRGFMGATFLPTDDQERKARILDAMCALPQHVTASAFQSIAHDMAPAAAACTLPMIYIGAGVPIDMDRFRALCPQLVVEQVSGVGHWLQLDAAERVNAAIDRFLDATFQAANAGATAGVDA
jgi:pimeloyl-ACP methyl ester carboxylesterase